MSLIEFYNRKDNCRDETENLESDQVHLKETVGLRDSREV